MDEHEDVQHERTTWMLVDGENIDATLGTAILERRPQSEERPRWDRLLSFAERAWGQECRGIFFLNASSGLPIASALSTRVSC